VFLDLVAFHAYRHHRISAIHKPTLSGARNT